jgi:hypothetical protein
MRKEYVKPMIGVELFTLTQSIALFCEDLNKEAGLGVPTHYDPERDCGWDMGNWIIFTSDNSSCKDEQLDGDEEFFEIYGQCYNSPIGGTEIFSS